MPDQQPPDDKAFQKQKAIIVDEVAELIKKKVTEILDQSENTNTAWLNLKKEALQAEIRNLNKKSYQKIEFWSFLSTTMVAILTVAILYFNGAFNVQSKLLELKVSEYKSDTARLNQQKIILANQIDSFQTAKKVDSVSAAYFKNESELLKAKFYIEFDSILHNRLKSR